MSHYVTLFHFSCPLKVNIVNIGMANSRISKYLPDTAIDKIIQTSDNNFTNSGIGMKTNILHSWKEISAYLDRDVRTCHRWEDELGLPIHRIDEKSPRSKVFAYKSDIDSWLRERANNHQLERKSSIWMDRRAIGGLAIGFLLLAVLFAFLYFFQAPTVPELAEPTLVVMPLKNLDSSENEEYFSEGLTNEIKRSLSRLNKIRVIPGSELGPYQTDRPDVSIDGHKINPDYLVMGEIRHDENKIYLSISLIKADDNKNVWNASYESRPEDIFNVSQNISHEIHEQLNVKVEDDLFAQENSGASSDFSAYDNYLKGSFIQGRITEQNDDPWKLYHQGKYLVGRWTPESNEMAIKLFKQAIALDNNYARAFIGLARCYANYVNFSWDSGAEWLDAAESMLQKAQEISPGLPEYYAVLIKINLLREDFYNQSMSQVVFNLAKEAIEKYPNDPQLNVLAGYCYMNRFAETGDEKDFEMALKYSERCFVLHPSSLNNIKYAELLMLKKKFYTAIEICQWMEGFDPSLFSKFMLGEIYYYLGDLEKSEEIFQQFDVPLNFNIHALHYLAMIQAQKGQAEEAKRIIRDVEFLSPDEYRDLPFHFELASIFFGIGDEDSGYRFLDLLFNDEPTKNDKFIYSMYIDIDKNFDNYRNDIRFQNLIRGDH